MNYENQTNVTLQNRHFEGSVQFSHCSNIRIENCVFQNANLKFVSCSSVSVRQCTFINANSTHSILCDQSNHIYIGYNYLKEPEGKSNCSDIINIYKSDNAVIEGNYIIGGGPSTTGGGIMLGDNFGSDQTARNNILIDCGQYGIAIAGGARNSILDNTIMAKKQPWTNVGAYLWGVPARNSVVTSATVSGNRISWTNSAGRSNPFWEGPNVHGSSVGPNIFNATYEVIPLPSTVGAKL